MAPGKGILKVCGILLIIFASIGFLIGALGLIGMKAVESSPETLELLEQAGTPYNAREVLIGGIVALLLGGLEITVGIIGVANCNRTDKAQLCFIAGVVALVCELGNSLYAAITSQFTMLNMIFMALALFLPILFIWGALKNKEVSNG